MQKGGTATIQAALLQLLNITAYSKLLFFFFEPVFGLVRIIHRCVQYFDFAEICI